MTCFSKLSTLLILFLLSFSTLQAQKAGGGDPVEMANKMTQTMTDSLTLSTAQAAKVKEINLEYGNKMDAARKAARENENIDREAMRATMTTLREDHKAALKNILTTEQFAKFEKMDAARQGKRREGRGGPEGRGDQ
jgi:periplasmic protein CpxP/Spy